MYLLISGCSKVVEADILRAIDRLMLQSVGLYLSLYLSSPDTDVDHDMAGDDAENDISDDAVDVNVNVERYDVYTEAEDGDD